MNPKTNLTIFFFFFSIFVLTGQGSIQSSDGKIMYLLTESLVERQSLSLPDAGETPEAPRYSKYGIGMSVLAVPFYLVGKGLSGVLGIDPAFATQFCVSMINALVTALSCLMIYRFARDRFRFSRRTAALLSLGFGLSTIAWYYSEDFMSEPATTLLLLLSAYWITEPNAENFKRSGLLVGLCLGLAVTCRLATLVAVPGFIAYRILVWKDRPDRSQAKAVPDLARLIAPLAVFLVGIGLYNYIRFQNVFETGYEHGFGNGFFSGLAGILFSPGKSVLLYNPLLILGCLALPVLYRTRFKEFVLFGWIVLAHLLLFSFWHSWYGGMGWGPRLMLVVLPFLILPVGFLLEKNPGFWKIPVTGLIGLGILIQIPSTLVNVSRYYYDLRDRFDARAEQVLLYSPAYSPIVGQWREVGAVLKNLRDPEKMSRMAADAVSKRRFIGKSDREVLDHGLAVNAPNFWWYYMSLFGYPFVLTLIPPLGLLAVSLFCGYRIFMDGKIESGFR